MPPLRAGGYTRDASMHYCPDGPMVASMSQIHPRIEMPVLDWSELA